jgi:hypothetical protein
MNRRPKQNGNGNGNGHSNGRGNYPLLEVRRPIQTPVLRRPPTLLPLVALCSALALGTALFIGMFMGGLQQPETERPIPKAEAFRWGVNRAMSAAELTQSAQSLKEWQQVASWWEEAVQLMQTVPISDQRYDVAVAKISEYKTNLRYAQKRAQAADQQADQPVMTRDLWGVGSRRAVVLKLQGKPTSAERYDSLCKEVLQYGKSQVELSNGLVVRYSDTDRNLKVSATELPLLNPQVGVWDVGSTQETVFQIQGTPSRVSQYDYSDQETLYYGNSTIELGNGRVTGYDNQDRNLKVRTVPVLIAEDSYSPVWTTNSHREDVLRVQGTPTQVTLNPSACAETLYYGNSVVSLKNGFVAGYDNLDRNLKVKAK